MADWDRSFDDLPSLDAIGEQIDAAARRDERHTTERHHRRCHGTRLGGRGPRRLLVAIVLALGFAGGVAYAATRLIKTGEPVPTRPGGSSGLDAIVPGTTRLLSIRAADPAGGPPWGLRVFRTKTNTACVQSGRVVGEKLGVLGQDGVFHNDGRFHELPVAAEGCGGLDVKGQMFMSGGANTQTASGYDGSGSRVVGGCETRQDRRARTDTPRLLRAALRLQLRRGEYALARNQRRTIARAERRAHQKIAPCPDADLRHVIWGFEGSLARKVTLTEHGHTRTLIPDSDDSGAYLAVLRGTSTDHQRLQRRTYYPGAIVCGRGYGVHATAGCSPPPGFAKPATPRVPAGTRRPPLRQGPPPPALHLPITVFPGLAIRFTPPFAGHRYQVLLRCRGNAFLVAYGPTVLPAGEPRTLRLHGPIRPGCDRRQTGSITDATTRRELGTFRLRRRR